MATTNEKTADKAQAMIKDATVRTQDAMNKSGRMFEQLTTFGQGNVEALMESSKIAARGIESMNRHATDYAKNSFDEASETIKTLSSVKSPTELMKLQSDFMRSQFDKMVAEASRSTEMMLKLAGDVAQPLSNRASVAVEKIKMPA